MSDADNPSFPGFGKLVPGFDFLQNLAKQAAGSATQNIPQLPNLGNWVAPTLNVEENSAGQAVYVEHHRTLGDRVRELIAAGFVLEDLIEPEWPEGRTEVWGQWSPLRGALLPGTAIFVARVGR